MYDVTEWKHVFKLDPNKEISDEQLEAICESGTDAILIGGCDRRQRAATDVKGAPLSCAMCP